MDIFLFHFDVWMYIWIHMHGPDCDGLCLVVDICHPLQYSVFMETGNCELFALFLFCLVDPQLHNFISLYFTYFKDTEIYLL
jgi:hypothetical protein